MNRTTWGPPGGEPNLGISSFGKPQRGQKPPDCKNAKLPIVTS
ncbi:hypothetical protein HMPREF0239_02834 [Clostridium sp. ATCC BAA-442]|nr:hypothetical protein HMPREF0239_02834 [Clostridium sp. ATCC BAA-442]